MVSASQTQIQTDDINISGLSSAGEYAYNFPVNFDTANWRVEAVRITTTAHQTYGQLGLAVPVKLRTDVNYSNGSTYNEIQWTGFEAGSTKTATSSFAKQTTQSGLIASIKLTYTLPAWAITLATCFFTVSTIVTLQSIVPSPPTLPPTSPPPPTVTASGNQDQSGGFDLFGLKIDPKWVLLGAGVLTAILLIRPSAPAQTILAFRGR